MRAFGYVFAATLIARLSSLGAFLITTRALSMADMGDLTVWQSVRALLLVVVLAGLPDIVARQTAVHNSQLPIRLALKVGVGLLAVAALLMEATLQFAPAAIPLPYPRLLLVAVAFDLVPGLFVGSLAATGRIRTYAVCIVLPAILTAAGTAILVRPPMAVGMIGPLSAYVGGSLVTMLMCVWLLLRHSQTGPPPPLGCRALLRQSLPNFGVAVAGTFIVTIDRYSIRWFAGAPAAAYYAVAFQVASLLSFGAAAVRTSLLARIILDIGNERVIRRYVADYLVCGAMFALMLATLAPEFIRLLAGARYVEHASIAPVLCAAILALEIFSFGQSLAVAREQSPMAFRSIFIAAFVALFLMPAACNALGAFGVGLALMVTYGIAAVAIHYQRNAVSATAVSWLVGSAALCGALAFHYRDVDEVLSTASKAVRYPMATICVAIGLLRLRSLVRERRA